jgi:tRNA pseudouridine55 synthase
LRAPALYCLSGVLKEPPRLKHREIDVSNVNGLLVIDKPGGITSRDAVDRVQTWFPPGTRIGHTGTLDPLATGVLVLCVGTATRLVEYVQRMGKTYQATITLGARSDTDDADGVVISVEGASLPSRSEVLAALERFLGEIEQIPPSYSAANTSGRRAYALARKGRQVTLAPRRVKVDAIHLLAYEYPTLELEVHCGKGTYIRSLARDLGEVLGCGAMVQTLRRTRVGPFTVESGVGLESSTALSHLLPKEMALSELPRVTFSADESRRLRHGQLIPKGDHYLAEGEAAAFDQDGKLIGIVGIQGEQSIVAHKVFK